MSQKLMDVYKSSLIDLAHTVVINHPYVGMSINKTLEERQYGKHTNPTDRATWKYYLNMAGLYHPYDEAEIEKINKEKGLGLSRPGINRKRMIILVAGDNGQIEKEFTVNNISADSADIFIAREYRIGERSYNELVETYPEFEILIQGILHPIDLTVSINAPNYELLYAGGYYRTRLDGLRDEYSYQKGTNLIDSEMNLIEEWEETLVDDLNRFTKNYFKQFDNNVYSEYNDLYFAANLGIYYLNLPSVIGQLRLERAKTREVHSTHVQFYLDSFAGLGKYISYLDREQMMYLYRNLDWLTANFGKKKIFSALLDILLYHKGIPVIFYNGEHALGNMQEKLDADYIFKKEYGKLKPIGDGESLITPEKMVELLLRAAKDNNKYTESQSQRINELGLAAPTNFVNTKIVHTKLINWGIQINGTFDEFVFCNWVYSAIKGELTGIVTINMPQNNNRLQMTVKNALIMFLYSYARGYLGKDPQRIRTLYTHSVPKTKDEIGDINNLLKHVSEVDEITQREVEFIYNKAPASRTYPSITSFMEKMEIAWGNYVDQIHTVYQENGIMASGQKEFIVTQMYRYDNIDIDLGLDADQQPITFTSWLAKFGISVLGNDDNFFRQLCDIIYNTVMYEGRDTADELTNMHKAMVNILRFFTSYSIQFITETDADVVRNIGGLSFRLEHVSTRYQGLDDFFIAQYPNYESIGQAKHEASYNGFNLAFSSSDDGNLLSQEQLRFLVLSENNEGILYKGGDT